ncbi:hypothetical protein FIBSPDRAFT_863625 [Athelia psychrophila]|uniref:Uncharacterized protein n=1 Tax=Athelia psychrophila TaxID=1759441 RepID=A0A166H8Y8_9AGAM|nr:hypothetical protein FIBSPDRAFT_863625 [Fibularhizoctonia sp. CBS 109695]
MPPRRARDTTLSFCLPSSALCHLPACCSVPRKSVAMSKAPTKLIKYHGSPSFHLHAHGWISSNFEVVIQRNWSPYAGSRWFT